MTPEEFKQRMEEIAGPLVENRRMAGHWERVGAHNDRKRAHGEADVLMSMLLDELGYQDGIHVYSQMPKFYA
jgi:hypothetical protein